MASPKKPKPIKPPPSVWKKNLKRLLGLIFKDHKLKLIVVFICIILSVMANVAGSLFLEVLIDDYITPLAGTENPYFGELLRLIGFMAMIYLTGVVSTLLFSWFMVDIAQSTLQKIRDKMFSIMQELSIKFFDTHSHGDLMSRYTNDTDTMRQMIAQSLPQMFSSLMTILIVLAAMIYTSLYLTGLVLFLILLMLTFAGKIMGRSSAFFKKQQESLGETNGYIEEMINGQKVIKVFCHEDEAKVRFDKINDQLCYNSTQANRFANILMPFMGNFGHLQYVSVAIVGGVLLLSGVGGITLGAIASFMQLTRTLSMPINQVSQQINNVIMAMAGADRVFELMDQRPEPDRGDVTLVHAKIEDEQIIETTRRTGTWAWKVPKESGGHAYVQLQGDVRLQDVDFSYDGKNLVLKDISIYAKPGQKVALVGSTGAGKTTITNLLNRFYDIADGKIQYDGININRIRKADLRRSLGMVLQDTTLFSGSVSDNIRYGRLDATQDDIEEAAKRANAHGFISLLPDGYETQLSGDAASLSQGQRQLIAIARAEVADAPVMILDEATSSIDTRTEIIVQRGMDALMEGRTVFVIAHRLSTVQNSNVIMVLEHGRIIERGDHDELLDQQGTYYQLYKGTLILT